MKTPPEGSSFIHSFYIRNCMKHLNRWQPSSNNISKILTLRKICFFNSIFSNIISSFSSIQRSIAAYELVLPHTNTHAHTVNNVIKYKIWHLSGLHTSCTFSTSKTEKRFLLTKTVSSFSRAQKQLRRLNAA